MTSLAATDLNALDADAFRAVLAAVWANDSEDE